MILSHGGNSIDLDVMEAEQTLTALESRYGIDSGDVHQPTVTFLQAVSAWLARKGLPGCTPTAAWQAWRAVFAYMDQCRRENTRNADIAHWFGVDPFKLSEQQRVGLLTNIGRVQAQGILQEGTYNQTDYKGLYALTLLATGDKHQAEKAKTQALERFVDAEIKSKRNC